MQKFIRVLAIIAAVLVALSFLLLLVSIPFQRVIASYLFKYPDSIIGRLPVFPLANFVNCLLLLGCAALMIVCAGNKKGGIWLEVLLFIALALVLPLINTLLSQVQNVVLAQVRGDEYVAANSVVNMFSSYCMWPGNLGRSLALVVCGMSIVFKRMSKKLDRLSETV